ncbi:hypothetical protein MFRU_071g00200 [Monilinia fructicola]|nr:hypothetical protein MFRU_071g00200 [Monilinia fructicola]
MNVPPEGIDDWHLLCACKKRRLGRAVTFNQVQSFAKNTCRLCRAFEQVILAVINGKLPDVFKGPKDAAESTNILNNLIVRPKDQHLNGHERYLDLLIMGKTLNIRLFVDAEDYNNFTVQGHSFDSMYPFEPETCSERGFRRAEKWLRECLRNHKCGQSGPSQVPTRLLDLQGSQVRLFETTGSEGPYACLSHRWGGPEYRRLTSTVTTIQTRMEGISWDTLPKTFQDAVIICRRLKINYLWIDTLCILQYCPSLTATQLVETQNDFARENSAMAKIYQNSYFTISADISTNMDSGIFSPCSPPKCFSVQVDDDNGNKATIYAKGRISHSDTPTDLETRGWTFQEFLLPSRVLHFGHFDITWRCWEVHTCECEFITGRHDGAHTWREALAKAAKPISENIEEASEWWARVVCYYMTRKLSNQRDKLPALSGLAQVYHKRTGDTYLAGLWRRSLLHDLCWYNYWEYQNRGPLLVGRRAEHYRAPSWSWASIDTLNGTTCNFWSSGIHLLHPISPSGTERPVCTLYEAKCELETSDPTGGVCAANIDLGVILIPARITKVVSTNNYRQRFPWTVNAIEDGMQVQECMPDCIMEDDNLKLGDKVFCAPIMEALTEDISQRGCIILKHLQGQKYQRVGFCVLEKKNNGSKTEESKQVTSRKSSWKFPDLTDPENAGKISDYALHFDANNCNRIVIV